MYGISKFKIKTWFFKNKNKNTTKFMAHGLEKINTPPPNNFFFTKPKQTNTHNTDTCISLM
jgi:hypothetical protein